PAERPRAGRPATPRRPRAGPRPRLDRRDQARGGAPGRADAGRARPGAGEAGPEAGPAGATITRRPRAGDAAASTGDPDMTELRDLWERAPRWAIYAVAIATAVGLLALLAGGAEE